MRRPISISVTMSLRIRTVSVIWRRSWHEILPTQVARYRVTVSYSRKTYHVTLSYLRLSVEFTVIRCSCVDLHSCHWSLLHVLTLTHWYVYIGLWQEEETVKCLCSSSNPIDAVLSMTAICLRRAHAQWVCLFDWLRSSTPLPTTSGRPLSYRTSVHFGLSTYIDAS